MRSIDRRDLLIAGGAVAASAASSAFLNGALAQSPAPFPAAPITTVHGYAPGGLADLSARLVADLLKEKLGVPQIVDAQPGAAGVIAARKLSRAKPDGYSIGWIAQSTLIVAPIFSDNKFDPFSDVTPICSSFSTPGVLTTGAKSRFRSAKDVIDEAKLKPRTITYASSGTNTTTHLTGELFCALAGIELVHVPYKGAAEYQVDLASGRIDLLFGTPFSLQSNPDEFRGLAISQLDRSLLVPDVPSASEVGLPGFVLTNWSGYFAPPGTPDAIIARLDKSFSEILSDKEARSKILRLGVEPFYLNHKEFAAFIRKEHETVKGIASRMKT